MFRRMGWACVLHRLLYVLGFRKIHHFWRGICSETVTVKHTHNVANQLVGLFQIQTAKGIGGSSHSPEDSSVVEGVFGEGWRRK